ncbi:MAG: TlpA family protein disulfide reductase [Phycisphaerae bacterium]|nr:TlpA family protein disulfide reductase [Phycisphaerae bacterium]
MCLTIARIAVFFGVFGLVPTAAWAELKVGDPAPRFSKKIEWLRGTPVDPIKNSGKEIYVLEFWATWCGPCIMQIPHTTMLQKKHEKHGVRFVALTSPGSVWQRQQVKDVKRFVREQGDKMGYTVGFDPTEETYNNYMAASGAPGIPQAFIITRDGKIAWQGHPNDRMEQVLEQMVSGKFDITEAIAAAATRKKLEVLGQRFNRLVGLRQWEQGLTTLHEMLELEPADLEAIQFSLTIITIEFKDRPRARLWVQTYIRNHRDCAAGLVLVAGSLMASPDLGDRHPDLVLAAATAACAADPKSIEAMQTRAQALHQIGRMDQAIEWQQKAVAQSDGTVKPQAQRALEFYQTCKRLAEG